MTIRTKKSKITKSEDVVPIIRAILNAEDLHDQDKEHFWIIGLNAKNMILYIDLVSLGSLTSSIVHPRETYRLAIMRSVGCVMTVHNHPSGDCTPSQEDIDITKRLQAAGEILGIKLLDHIIVGENEHYSFHDAQII